MLICYILFFGTSLLTTSTVASFNHVEKVDWDIHAGTWSIKWKYASIDLAANSRYIESCEQVPLTVDVKNESDYVTQSGNYQILLNGYILSEGDISEMAAKDTHSLQYVASEPGTYTFRIYQVDEDDLIEFSEDIMISCTLPEEEEKKKEMEEKEKENEEKNNNDQGEDEKGSKDNVEEEKGKEKDKEKQVEGKPEQENNNGDKGKEENTEGDAPSNSPKNGDRSPETISEPVEEMQTSQTDEVE